MEPEIANTSDLDGAFFFLLHLPRRHGKETNILHAHMCCACIHDSISAGNLLEQLDVQWEEGNCSDVLVSIAFCYGLLWDQLQGPNND